MLLASSPVHRLEAPLVGGSEVSACRLQRRYTISESRSIRMQAKRHKRPLIPPRLTNLDSVIEQTDSFHDCSQQPEDRTSKKHSAVTDICEPGQLELLPLGKSSTLPRNFALKHTDLVNGMAWKGSKQQQQQSSSTNNDPSWLETIYTNLAEKKRKSGIFGSLRGRSKEKKKESPPSSGNSSGNPKSPLLVGKSRTRSDTDPAKTKKKVIQTRPSLEFQGSTGFQLADNVDVTDSNDSQLPSGASRRELTLHQRAPGVNRVAHVRKANSLPRTVLCSPVMTHKVKRPASQWLHKDFASDDIPMPSPSPPSSNVSSRISSVDTLQPSVNVSEDYGVGSMNTPTATEGWQTMSSTRAELVHKTSLTRSSSLPFEAEIILSEQSLGKEMSDKVLSGEFGARFAVRSQSFNTHFNSHSVVQKTSSYEEMIMRERVLSFLLETEQSYIQSLKALTKDYMGPLAVSGLMEDLSVKEIFSAVEELTSLHVYFASRVEKRVSNWTSGQTIGPVLLDMFSCARLVTVYNQYIQHYSKARLAIESCKQSKPSLAKELEECSRDNHNRLGLKDLLIKPVQRIPRYMLFVKDIIKYTSHTHPDYLLLQQALSELTSLADCVNETERVSDKLQQHKELLSTVDGLAECVTSSSVFLRCDVITEMKGSVHRKDRLLLLFSDAVVCAGIRRRSTGFRRGSLMNINSTQNSTETSSTRYRVKWCSSLSSLSVTHSQAPLFERRRYNTLEKLLHNSQKDEALLIQMMTLSSNLHCSHHHLNTMLQDMLDQLRSGMTTRQQEMETLPHDSARLDLISHDSSQASKYFLVFSTQRERQQWEQALRNAQLSSTSSLLIARLKLEDDHSAPSSPLLQRQSSLKTRFPHFLSHLSLPSCRVGSQLSSSAVSIGPNSQQLFITINDTCGRGSVAIISTTNGMSPRLIATLPLSSSNLLCALCVLHPTGCRDDGCSEKSFSLSDSGDIHFFNGHSNVCSTPLSAAANESSLLKSDSFDVLRSSSAPPTSNKALMENNYNGWSPAPSRPAVPVTEQWLWLGSEGGVVYLLKMGVSSLHVGTSISFNLRSPVECLLAHNNRVWAGLRDGRIAMFHLQPEITYEYFNLSPKPNPRPVSCLSPAGHMILAATGNTIVGVSSLTGNLKDQLELSAHHKIVGMVVSSNLVFISVRDTLLVFICAFNESSLEVVCTMDCTNTVLSALKNYDSIVRQHKCSYPHITSMSCTNNMLVVGTSTGVLVYLPLPLVPGHTPSPQALSKGQVDDVSILNVMATEGRGHILVTGGHGLEDLLKCQVSNSASETEGCLMFWKIPS